MSETTAETGTVIDLDGVTVVRDRRHLLSDVTWRVRPHEKWVVLGPNGAGKTTMLQVASGYLSPTLGTATILGHPYGTIDVRDLRERIGYAGAAPAELVHGNLIALEIVVTGKHASFVRAGDDEFDDADWENARHRLDQMSAAHLEERRFGTLSSGEKQRVLIARSLMTDPELLMLDEATTGLDLGAREQLIAALGGLAADSSSAATVLVTHHVEEIPAGFDRIVLLASGSVVAAGPIEDVLTAEALSASFDHPLTVERHQGRYRAWSP